MTTEKIKELLKKHHFGFQKWVDDVLNNQSREVIEIMKGLSKEALFDMYLKELPEPTIEPEVSAEEVLSEFETNSEYPMYYHESQVILAMEKYASLSKQEVGEGKDLEASLGNSGNASVVSHSSTVGNTNEQK
jgi:hypothetical protein